MSAPISYDEAEANRRLRAAEAVIAAARAFHAAELRLLLRPGETAERGVYRFALGALAELHEALAAYDAATSDEDAAQTA